MKKILSLLLTAVLLIGMFPVGMTASAEGGVQINTGSTYNIIWGADEVKQLCLSVEETGFYDLSIVDNFETAEVYFELYPADGEISSLYDGYHWFFKAISTYRYGNLYLREDQEYLIDLDYYYYDEDDECYDEDANIDISFTKVDYQPESLALNGSCTFYESDVVNQWITFKTVAAGDYLFETNDLVYGWFYIYEKESGEYACAITPESFKKNRVRLTANTDYVMVPKFYDPYYCWTEISFSKAETDIVDIQVEQNFDILANHHDYIDSDYATLYAEEDEFAYKVTFSDQNQEYLWYSDLTALGVQIEIEYNGDIYTYTNAGYEDYYLAAGTQPVTLWAGNKKFTSSIYIKPYLEWLKDDGIATTTDYEEMTIEYENENEQGVSWRICPDETNMYELYAADWSAISIRRFNIFDKDNKIIPYTAQGWKLTGGVEYSLNIDYTYNEGSYDTINFEMRPHDDHKHTYANDCDADCNLCGNVRTAPHSYGEYVYNKDATSTKDGTKTRTCSVCKKTETVTATGTKIKNPFTDVKAGEYYTEPVLWAVGKDITNGTSASTFSPADDCTRGQIVTFLWRAAGSPEPTSARNPFVDVKSNQYYYKAVLWAVEKGITNGMDATHFAPDATCTRGQVVTFLWRAKGKPTANTSNSFTDVKKGAYYYDAVLWAVKNGIANGMGNNKFAPDTTCTRGQIVTFLYRAYK